MGQPHRTVRMATVQDLPCLHRLTRRAAHRSLGGHHVTAAAAGDGGPRWARRGLAKELTDERKS
ncbi:hypothetical protein BJF90_22220 [Pseudonocardia sp. CNS-004]|nr:hypothetical protein BJF90_22220 [Pseudonocardia sp. CNS-004]